MQSFDKKLDEISHIKLQFLLIIIILVSSSYLYYYYNYKDRFFLDINNFSLDEISQAGDYVLELKNNDLMHVFPSKDRSIISNNNNVGFDLRNYVSKLEYINISGSSSFPIYIVEEYKTSNYLCTAKKSIPFNEWISSGVITIYNLNSDNYLDVVRCVESAFDYINGFPTKDGQFDLFNIPSPNIRNIITTYLYKCASINYGNKSDKSSRSRGGMFPLPSLYCVHQEIKMLYEKKVLLQNSEGSESL